METLDAFQTRWRERCKEIKGQSFSGSQCIVLDRQYTLELAMADVLRGWNLSAADILTLQNELRLALHVALSNYRKQGNWVTRTLKRIEFKPKVILNNNEWQ